MVYSLGTVPSTSSWSELGNAQRLAPAYSLPGHLGSLPILVGTILTSALASGVSTELPLPLLAVPRGWWLMVEGLGAWTLGFSGGGLGAFG